MDIVKGNMGWIEVIVGPMFSGKSEELIRRLKRAEYARQRVQIFKPQIDRRYSDKEIKSQGGWGSARNSWRAPRTCLRRWKDAPRWWGSMRRNSWASRFSACAASLGPREARDRDGPRHGFLGCPFEPMPRLLAHSEEITKLLAICVRCGNPAVYTQRRRFGGVDRGRRGRDV